MRATEPSASGNAHFAECPAFGISMMYESDKECSKFCPSPRMIFHEVFWSHAYMQYSIGLNRQLNRA